MADQQFPPGSATLAPSPAHVMIRCLGASASMLQAVTEVIDKMPAVSGVIADAGGLPAQHLRSLVALHRHCRGKRMALTVDFLLDDAADASAALGKRPTSLTGILDASRTLRLAGVNVRWWVPATTALAYRLEAIFSLARDERLDAILTPSVFFDSVSPHLSRLDPNARRFVLDFLQYRLLDEEGARLGSERRRFYEAVRETLTTGAQRFEHHVRRVFVLSVDQTGSGWALTEDNQPALVVTEETLPGREPDPAIAGETQTSQVAGVLVEGVRAWREWAVTSLIHGVLRPARTERPLERVLVIGAYGGEHIGDTAILGGVLSRVHQRYGTVSAILMSQRPDHTRHLVPMLDTPVSVAVEDYRQSRMAALLTQVDAVVFAGGPLMDLPKQLVKHLYTVSLARRDGKPFILEGIGAGPFLRRPSALTARRLVKMAARISVRTRQDADAPLVHGMEPTVGRDPAFDYLETRGHELTRLPDVDRDWLDRLFRETEGRLIVALNLRPIRADYTSGVASDKRVEYTRFIETRFEERLAEAMRQFHKTSSRRPCFIFFPMNAIQFGSSDLRSAYRLTRLLRGEVDFRVWEGDASIDGVVALLRRVDAAITMRFHATIFSLAQGRRVIGIDYRIGMQDKVAALLNDVGRSEDCARVDEMTSGWMLGRLSTLS